MDGEIQGSMQCKKNEPSESFRPINTTCVTEVSHGCRDSFTAPVSHTTCRDARWRSEADGALQMVEPFDHKSGLRSAELGEGVFTESLVRSGSGRRAKFGSVGGQISETVGNMWIFINRYAEE